MSGLAERIAPHVALLYPDQQEPVVRDLVALAERYVALLAERPIEPPTHATACLITYGDGFRRPGEAPLHTLSSFLRDLSLIHI